MAQRHFFTNGFGETRALNYGGKEKQFSFASRMEGA